MKQFLVALFLVGCALKKDPNQGPIPIQQGDLIIQFDTPENAPQGQSGTPPFFDSVEISVIGEFGVITAEGNPVDGSFELEVPPGPDRIFQVIARDAENPVLLGSAVVDIDPENQEPISIQVRDAAGFTLNLLDTGLSLLPLDTLQVSSLGRIFSEQFTLFPKDGELLPLPIDIVYQIDNLPAGFRPPEGEGFLFLDDVGVPVQQDLVLLNDSESASIEISVEGLSLRIKVVDSLGSLVPISGSISLLDQGGLLSLPPLINLTPADGGQVLLTNVLTVVSGVFGVAVVSAKLDDVARSKGTLPVVLLDILPAGAPTKLEVFSASDTLEGFPRPEPGDLIIVAVDALGRVATSAQTTVNLSVSGGAFLRQGNELSDTSTTPVTITLNQGVALLKRSLLPKRNATSLTVTASANGLTSGSVVVGVQ
jgi:hypothetical protein